MLSKDTSGLGVGCHAPGFFPPLSGLSITGLTTERKRNYKLNQQIQLKTTAPSLRNLVNCSPRCGKYERQSKRYKGYEENSNNNISDGGGNFFGASDIAAF